MIYEEVFRALYQKEVRYLICGGLAVNIYGIPRMTADIDILLDFEEKNLKNFSQIIKKSDYSSLIPISIESLSSGDERKRLLEEKNLVAYSYYSTIVGRMNLDVLVNVPFSFDEMWAAREIRPMDDFEIYLVSVDHLIKMKEFSNRVQDQQDIFLLSKMIENGRK